MRLVPLFALAAVTAAAPAQTAAVQTSATAAQSTSGVVVLQAPSTTGCPVGLEARHAGDGGLVSISPSTKHPEQAYRIIFSPGKDRAIAQARITLYGMSGHHVIPAAGATRNGADADETFNVSPSSGAGHLFRSTVYPEKLTGVQWVELNEITYADGTKWHASPTVTCRVAPNGFLLVTAGN